MCSEAEIFLEIKVLFYKEDQNGLTGKNSCLLSDNVHLLSESKKKNEEPSAHLNITHHWQIFKFMLISDIRS